MEDTERPMEELVGESRTGEERGFVGGSEDRENKDGAEATGAWIDDTGEIMVAEGVSEMDESEVVGEIGAAEDAVWETDAAADEVDGAEDDVVNGAEGVVNGAEDKVDAPDTGIKGINPEVVGARADFDNAIDDTGEMGVGEDSGMSNDESEAI
mgnify:CR=1 FL=1